LEIRKITDGELEETAWLHRYAFGGWSDEKKEDWIAWLKAEDTVGLFDGGKLVSTVVITPFQQSVRGVLKGMGGIAAVASYPEARRKGYVRDLFKTAFADMHERGLPVSMLSAFKRSFYAQFGYVTANTSPLVKTSVKSLRPGLDLKVHDKLSVERVRAVDAKDSFIEFVQEFCPSRYHGFVLKTDISDVYWRLRNKDLVLALVKDKERVQGLARYRIKSVPTEIPGDGEQSMFVHEMYWRNLAARDALLRFFASHVDQMENITFYLPFWELFEHWFPDANWSMRSWQAWAVRVVDAENALRDLPAQGTGRVVIDIADEFCEWNNGTLRLTAGDGRLGVEHVSTSVDAKFSIEGLSALVYGTIPLEEIEYMGWGEVRGSSRQILQRWFPVQPIHNAFDF